MSLTKCAFCLCFILFNLIITVKTYTVAINSTGSTVVGSTVNFTAILYDDGKIAKSGDYEFQWKDNSNSSRHFAKFKTDQPYSNWSINYLKDDTKCGTYQVTLVVYRYIFDFICIVSATNNVVFNITESLDGGILLMQNGVSRRNEFVSTLSAVNHTIDIRQSDLEYISKSATYIQTYWFQNCTYVGMSNDLSYVTIYPLEEIVYEVEALVVASFQKLPEPTTSSTTTSTTTTSTTPTTTLYKPTISAYISRKKRNSDVLNTLKIAYANAGLLGININYTHNNQYITNNGTKNVKLSLIDSKFNYSIEQKDIRNFSTLILKPEPPYICVNQTIISRDPKKLYGYFKHHVISKSPITNFSANGKNWLQYGDLLNLEINCKASDVVEYCTLVFKAPYNATGNETCNDFYRLHRCQLKFIRFFTESKVILFFLRNDVSNTMNQVTINIYEAKIQSQLSVVVVPVFFTLIAIILVIFGVSYYIQSQNRFTVEVADFNFGDTQSVDMEYKTFQQRLLESICEVTPICLSFSRSNLSQSPTPENTDEAESNLRYNPMV